MSLCLEIKNLKFEYENRPNLFKSFNYELAESSIALWVGPSGFGKSTLGKIIVSHLLATSGELKFFGQILSQPSLDRFYVGSDNDLFAWKTLRKQFDFLQNNIKYERMLKKEKVMTLAGKLEISNLLDKYPSQISTGEMRRFQILRSLMINSKLMVFDETFSALDLNLKNRIMPVLIEQWHEQKTTVIIISHESDKNFNYKFDQIVDFSTFLSER